MHDTITLRICDIHSHPPHSSAKTGIFLGGTLRVWLNFAGMYGEGGSRS